ncbi:MAG: TRAP transporter small permease [Burkholderiaceae bacterium]
MTPAPQAASLPPNASLLQRLDYYLAKVEDGLSMVAAMFILLLMLLGAANIIGRKLGIPVWGYNDLVTLIMVSFAFLSISAMQRVGGHIRMELVVRALSGRTMWVTELIGTLVAIFIMSILMWYSYEALGRAFSLGDSTMDREIPTWPSKMWVPISFGVLILRLLLQLWGYSRMIINPDAEPIAIPLLHEVKELAEKEISDTFGDAASTKKSGAV